MVKLCERDTKLVGVGAAMPSGTGLKFLRDELPDRYFDVGIAEEHAVIFAAGMATMDYRPIVAIYSTFLQRAYDCIIHDVALQDLPVIFCMDRAGLSANDGPTHHGLESLEAERLFSADPLENDTGALHPIAPFRGSEKSWISTLYFCVGCRSGIALL